MWTEKHLLAHKPFFTLIESIMRMENDYQINALDFPKLHIANAFRSAGLRIGDDTHITDMANTRKELF